MGAQASGTALPQTVPFASSVTVNKILVSPNSISHWKMLFFLITMSSFDEIYTPKVTSNKHSIVTPGCHSPPFLRKAKAQDDPSGGLQLAMSCPGWLDLDP